MIRLWKKIAKSKAGFSLAETLLVVLLLALLGSAITGGLRAALNAHRKVLRRENAEILADTMLSTLKTELQGSERLGQAAVNVGNDQEDQGPVTVFLSHSKSKLDGMQIGFWVNSSGRLMVSYFSNDGGSYEEISATDSKFSSRPMLTEKSYPNDLYPELKLDPISDDKLKITVRIYYRDGDSEEEVTEPKNPPSVTVGLTS